MPTSWNNEIKVITVSVASHDAYYFLWWKHLELSVLGTFKHACFDCSPVIQEISKSHSFFLTGTFLLTSVPSHSLTHIWEVLHATHLVPYRVLFFCVFACTKQCSFEVSNCLSPALLHQPWPHDVTTVQVYCTSCFAGGLWGFCQVTGTFLYRHLDILRLPTHNKILLYVCLWIIYFCTCVQCIRVCMFVCVHLCVSQRSTLGIFLSCSPRYYLETGSHTEPRAYFFSYTSCPVHSGDPPLLCFLSIPESRL